MPIRNRIIVLKYVVMKHLLDFGPGSGIKQALYLAEDVAVRNNRRQGAAGGEIAALRHMPAGRPYR
jgi:hypothetical protein